MPGERQEDRFAEYLDSLRDLLKINRQRRNQIEDELRDHVEERVGELTARGMESEAATALALSEFGDAATLAADFSQVTRHSKRNQIMRLCTTSAAIALILFMGFSMLHPNGQTEGTAQQTIVPAPPETPPAPSTSPASLSVNQDERNEATRQLLSETSVDLDLIEMPVADCLNFLKEECDGLQWYASASLSTGNATQPQAYTYGGYDEPAPEAGYGGGSYDQTPATEYSNPGGYSEGYSGAYNTSPRAYMDANVTIELTDIPVEMALRLILDQAGLGYYLDNGVVIVTDVATAAARLDIRVYDISGLIAAVESNPNAGTAYSPQTTYYTPNTYSGHSPEYTQSQSPKDVASQIIQLVLSVGPDTWDEVGGPGSVNVFQNALVVRQTEEVHLQLEEFLKVVESVVSNNSHSMPQPPTPTSSWGTTPTSPPATAYNSPVGEILSIEPYGQIAISIGHKDGLRPNQELIVTRKENSLSRTIGKIKVVMLTLNTALCVNDAPNPGEYQRGDQVTLSLNPSYSIAPAPYQGPQPGYALPPQTSTTVPPTPYRQTPYPAEQQPQRANPATPTYAPPQPPREMTPTPAPPQHYVPQTEPNPSRQPTMETLTPTYQPRPNYVPPSTWQAVPPQPGAAYQSTPAPSSESIPAPQPEGNSSTVEDVDEEEEEETEEE